MQGRMLLAAYALITFRSTRARRRAGLQGAPLSLWAIKTLSVSAVLIAAICASTAGAYSEIWCSKARHHPRPASRI